MEVDCLPVENMALGMVNDPGDPGDRGAIHVDVGGRDGVTRHDPNPRGRPLRDHGGRDGDVNSAGGPAAARRDDVGGCRDALRIDPGIRCGGCNLSRTWLKP